MAIEYLGLSSINGPLIALEGVQDAFFDEIVDFCRKRQRTQNGTYCGGLRGQSNHPGI